MRERLRIQSGSPYEDQIGFSRALRVGDRVLVAGTAPVMPGDADPAADTYGQARRAFEIAVDALREAGASSADVVRTRMYLVPGADPGGAGRAHREAFGDARPVATMVYVAALLDPRWLVEVEVEAVVGG